MTEFSETMRKWTRMCEYYGDDCGDSPSRCPLADMHGICGAIYDMSSSGEEWESAERKINEWHEPVYPTWAEWLMEHGLVYAGDSPYMKRWFVINQSRIEKPIPADIAEKLGIKPKEE